MQSRFSQLQLTVSALMTATVLTACVAKAPPPPSEPLVEFRQWQASEPGYTLFPGDTVRLNVLTAEELDREEITVGPDGRIQIPLGGSLMVAGLTLEDAETRIEQALENDLIDPAVNLTALSYASQQVFVGGAVREPGIYPLQSEIGVLEAVLTAGGFTETAAMKSVVVIRRAPGGGAMTRVINIGDGVRHPVYFNADEPLQRFDIVYVPETTVAEVGQAVQRYLQVLPFQFSLFYDLAEVTG